MSAKYTRSLQNNRRNVSLGSGLTSRVRKYYLDDGLPVAVKSCRIEDDNGQSVIRYTLVTECAILKYCKEHIPTLSGFLSNGIVDYFRLGYHELIMPVADGTLLDCFNHSTAKKVSYSRQLITAVGLLHEYGIIHRDIKPENILRFRDEIRLADFGAATYFSHSELLWKDRETVPLGYRPPELLFDYVGSYGPEIDSWSLGVVLWELFVKRSMIDPEKNLLLCGKEEREIIIACSLLRMYESPLNKEWPEIIFTSQWSIYAPYFDILDADRNAGTAETYGTEWRQLLRGCPLIDEITRLLRWNPTERPSGVSLIHLCHSMYVIPPNINERPYPSAIKSTNRKEVLEKLVAVCSLWNYATTTILRSITYYDIYLSKVIDASFDTGIVHDSHVVAAVALSIAADQHEIVNHPYKGYVASFALRYTTTEEFSRMVINFLKTLDYDLVISNAYFEAENLMINGLSPPHLEERIIHAYVRGDCFKYSIRDLARNIIKDAMTPIITDACEELSEALLREAIGDLIVTDVKPTLERVISR